MPSNKTAKPTGAQLYDGRRSADIHGWFGLTYASYLVLPRSVMEAMPILWQKRMVRCLTEIQDSYRHLGVNDNYTVLLRGAKGRIVKDPYADYRHSAVEDLTLKRRDKRERRVAR